MQELKKQEIGNFLNTLKEHEKDMNSPSEHEKDANNHNEQEKDLIKPIKDEKPPKDQSKVNINNFGRFAQFLRENDRN